MSVGTLYIEAVSAQSQPSPINAQFLVFPPARGVDEPETLLPPSRTLSDVAD